MILGIGGKARSGKDTFAGMLAEELFEISKQRFVLMAYATELKERVQKDFDLSYDQLWGDDKEKPDTRYPRLIKDIPLYGEETPGKPKEVRYWTAREMLQAYGQFFRSIESQFWVRNLFDTIAYKEYKNVIITDCRHPNEIDVVKEHGGIGIRIKTPTVVKISDTQHISETALDDYHFDIEILNDGDLDDLRIKARDTALAVTKIIKLEANNG